MKVLGRILFIFSLLSSSVISQTKDHAQMDFNCKTCHVCEVPTEDDPCLIICPRFSMTKEYPSPDSITQVILIDKLEERYTPVVFTHKLHAQMSEMTGGCLGCHHYNTLGPILSCSACHSINRKRETVRLPDLKGAYHQKCLSCHRQWSRQTECKSCHQEKDKVKSSTLTGVDTELKMKSHPPVKIPTKIVYQTASEKGKLVTFYHNDHSKQFELACINCHKNENCIRCHDAEKTGNIKNGFYDTPVKVNLPEEERHKRCFTCHKEDKCVICHSNAEKKSFNHKIRSGWELNRFHKNLSCRKCHNNAAKYSDVKKECNSCHFGWNSESFDHKITGLVLDEDHLENSCEDCHINLDFKRNPECDSCHDDKNYPEHKPGKLI